MTDSRLEAAKDAYCAKGFQVVRNENGALLVTRDAPAVSIVGRKGGQARSTKPNTATVKRDSTPKKMGRRG
jgi:hypothetical protein